MGKAKIKHLGKRKNKKNRLKKLLLKVSIIIGILVSFITLLNVSKYMEELFKERNIENNTIEFYMDIADEIGEKKVQLSWKELLAIDMVKNNEDLSSIKKKDIIDVGKVFIIKTKDKYKNEVWKVKSFDKVLDEINFNDEEKKKATNYLKSLEQQSLSGIKFETQKDNINFINEISTLAKENYKNYKILPSITVAQAILESGWGQSSLTKNGNNVFGIKADSRWKGDRVEVSTSENYDDKIKAYFRVYKSIDESVKDQGRFLTDNKRYEENGLFKATHYTTQAQALEDAGYSTKKDKDGELIYADMLIQLIRNYNLQLLDRQVETEK